MKTLKKLEVELSPEMEKIGNELQEINHKLISGYIKSLNDVMEKFVRQNAKPPIKGDITKGKVKWRGLRWCSCLETNETWVQQRGEDITPRVTPQNIHKYL